MFLLKLESFSAVGKFSIQLESSGCSQTVGEVKWTWEVVNEVWKGHWTFQLLVLSNCPSTSIPPAPKTGLSTTFLSCDKRNKSWYLKEFIFGVMKRYKCIVNCIWMSLVAPLVVPYWEVIIRLWVGLMGLGSNLKMWPEIDLSGIRKQQIINSIVWLTEDLDARLARWGREIPPSDLHLQFFFWILSAWRRQYSIRELLESSKSLSPIYARWNFQPRTI